MTDFKGLFSATSEYLVAKKAMEREIEELVIETIFGELPSEDPRLGKIVEVRIEDIATREKTGPPYVANFEGGNELVGDRINEMIISAKIVLRNKIGYRP